MTYLVCVHNQPYRTAAGEAIVKSPGTGSLTLTGYAPGFIETLYVGGPGEVYSGYGQDELLSDGDMSTGSWMLNHKGNTFIEYTDDFGATWKEIRMDANSGRIFQRMIRYSDGVWLINHYRISGRNHRFWTMEEPIPDSGGWKFIAGNNSSYTHGHAYEGKTLYSLHGNNNSNDNMQKYTNWYPDDDAYVLETGNTASGTGSTSGWDTHVTSTHIYAGYGGQGQLADSYSIWDKSTLNYVKKFVDVLYNARTSAHDGSGTIKSAGDTSNGACVGSTVKVQTWGFNGVTEETATYTEDINGAKVHYTNNKWFLTCYPLSDLKVLFVKNGTSGSDFSRITLPYTITSGTRFSVRYVSNGEYLIAYLGNVGGTANTTVLIKAILP
jgi:hypothetical protein